jgi:hypothetical protein
LPAFNKNQYLTAFYHKQKDNLSMIGKTITGTSMQGHEVTGIVVDKINVPQPVQMGSSLQGGQMAIMPADMYLVLENEKVHMITIPSITRVV